MSSDQISSEASSRRRVVWSSTALYDCAHVMSALRIPHHVASCQAKDVELDGRVVSDGAGSDTLLMLIIPRVTTGVHTRTWNEDGGIRHSSASAWTWRLDVLPALPSDSLHQHSPIPSLGPNREPNTSIHRTYNSGPSV